jgi:hypothetical protein
MKTDNPNNTKASGKNKSQTHTSPLQTSNAKAKTQQQTKDSKQQKTLP